MTEHHEIRDARPQFIMVGYDALALWADEELGLKPTALLAYATLLRYARQDGAAWPSVETLASETRMNRTTVMGAIKALEKAGLLRIEKERAAQGYDRNIYVLTSPGEKTDGAGAKKPTRAGRKNRPSSGENSDTNQKHINQMQLNQRTATADAPAAEPEPERATVKPLDLIEAFNRISGQAMPVNRGKAFGSAKTLLDAGVTPEEIEGCTRWIASQDWARERGYDFGTLVNQIDRWRTLHGTQEKHRADKPRQIRSEAQPVDVRELLKREWQALDDGQLQRLDAGEPLETVLDDAQRAVVEREQRRRVQLANMTKTGFV